MNNRPLYERDPRRIRHSTPLAHRAFVHPPPTLNIPPPLDNEPPKLDTKSKRGRRNLTAKMTSPTTTKVLVYHHRHNATNPIVPDGLAVMATSELETILANSK